MVNGDERQKVMRRGYIQRNSTLTVAQYSIPAPMLVVVVVRKKPRINTATPPILLTSSFLTVQLSMSPYCHLPCTSRGRPVLTFNSILSHRNWQRCEFTIFLSISRIHATLPSHSSDRTELSSGDGRDTQYFSTTRYRSWIGVIVSVSRMNLGYDEGNRRRDRVWCM